MNYLLSNEDWLDVLNGTDTNTMVTNFLDTVLHNLNIAVPLKKVANNYIKHKSNNTWITKGIQISCRKKRMMYHTYKTTDNCTFKMYYKNYCRILRKVIHQAKNMHNNNFILASNNINKALWHTVRKEVGVNKDIKEPFKLLYNNKEITNSHEIANIFNTYFSEIANNLISNTTNCYLFLKHKLMQIPSF